jgi:hypothetical protein
MRLKFIFLAATMSLMLVACAPDNLDITPSPTSTNTPEPTATRQPTVEGATPTPEATAEAETVSAEAAMIDAIFAAIPNPFNAGTIQWRRGENDLGQEIVNPNADGGAATQIFFNEAGGGLAELTIAEFATPEAAQAFYDRRRGDNRLDNADEEAEFPTPNAFGGGTYGSLGLILDGNRVIVVSIPRFSSTVQGNPTVPFSRELLALIAEVEGG